MENARNLVCGDTRSDIPMVEASMEKSANTCAIFVTKEENLKSEVRRVCPYAFFVSTPDTLVSLLHDLSHTEEA